MKKGFTLIELSIVLVVVGLLIGGVLVGQSLYESAKVRAQVGALQQYDIALRGFYQKFRGIPGDSNKTPTTDGFPPTQDGVLRDFSGWVPIGTLWGESSSYFPALSQYGFIKDKHTMVHDGAIYYRKGRNYPRLAINPDRGLLALTNTNGDVFYYVGLIATGVIANPRIVDVSTSGVMSPEQAAAIDNKMDDGLPSTGDVTATTTTRINLSAGLPYALDTASACIVTGTPNQYNAANPSNTLCRLLVKAVNYR